MESRTKAFYICIALILLLLMSACSGAPENDTNNGFILTEIETGFMSVGLSQYGMTLDYLTNTAYTIGIHEFGNSPSYVCAVDTETFAATALDHNIVFDESQDLRNFYPCNTGYWLFVSIINTNEGVRRTDHDEAWFYTREYEFVSSTSIEKDSSVCGATNEGHLVVQQGSEIYTLDSEGVRVQTWDVTDAAAGASRSIWRVAINGNDIYFTSLYGEGNNKTSIFKLRADGGVEKLFTLDFRHNSFFAGSDGRFYLSSADDRLFVLNENGKPELLFSMFQGGSSGSHSGLVVLGEDRYIIEYGNKIFLATKDSDEAAALAGTPDPRKILTIACYGGTGISPQVEKWNKNSDEYRIEILDYSQYDDGVMRLNLDMLSGNAPDMIFWDSAQGNPLQIAPFTKGYLLDLYTMLDSDPDVGRETLAPSLLKALESSSGALYELPTSFMLWLVAGSVDVVGTEPGWTPDEFLDLLESRPEAEFPFGTRRWQDILGYLIFNNMDTYVDWETGESHFDSDEFKRFLDIAKVNYENVTRAILEARMIKEGRQLLSWNIISTVNSIQKFPALFGGEVNYIGLPTSQGIGNTFMLFGSYSICAQSENVDASWEFLKRLITYEAQMTEQGMFPPNAEALEERLNNPTEYEEGGGGFGTRDEDGEIWRVTLGDPTPEDSAIVRQIIESCDRVYREDLFVMAIIEDEAPSYFSGDKTIDEVVRLIQARVQTYISEQS